MNILILFAHPAFEKSRVNKFIVNKLSDRIKVTFHDLYEEYPEFDIDIKKEQSLLTKHDCIIFQFPFFWYSTPAILKEWQDLVLEHDWAYGSKGKALEGKLFFSIISTGGPRNAYRKGSFHNHTMKELTSPLTQTARLCKMQPLPPFVIHGTHGLENEDLDSYKQSYLNLLDHISKNKFDAEKAKKLDYLNSYKF